MPRRLRRGRAGLTICGGCLLAVCLWLAGCATPPAGDQPHTLNRRLPPANAALRPDRDIVASFFAANGISLTEEQLLEILPDHLIQGKIDRTALRRIAKENKRMVVVVKAGRNHLGDLLDLDMPLLLYLPASMEYRQTATLYIPVLWDARQGILDLLGGSGELKTISANEFFAVREPLKQAALCLLRPKDVRRESLSRGQKLLLADFWYQQKNYRKAAQLYEEIDDDDVSLTGDVEALLGRANVLMKRKRPASAIPLYRAALESKPDDPRILNNLAYAMSLGGGELMTALRYADKANRLSPGNPVILETLGTINLQVGDGDTAARLLEEAWGRSLKRSPDVQMAIMEQLIRAWFLANRTDLAWQVAEYRHRAFPDHPLPKDITKSFPQLRVRYKPPVQ